MKRQMKYTYTHIHMKSYNYPANSTYMQVTGGIMNGIWPILLPQIKNLNFMDFIFFLNLHTSTN